MHIVDDNVCRVHHLNLSLPGINGTAVMVPASWSSQCTATMRADSAACYTAGPGPSSMVLSSVNNSRCRQPCRARSKAQQLQPVAQLHPVAAAKCCHRTCHSSQHAQHSVLSAAGVGIAASRHSCAQHSGWQAAVACQAHAGAGTSSGTSSSRTSYQLQPTAASSSSRQPSSLLTPPDRPSRSTRTQGASLALAEPTAAAATAVASAAVGASSFNLSQFVAVVLGYAVMAGSLFRSVPQILKVLQHQSTEGLSLTSYVVELCCYSISIAYNISQVSTNSVINPCVMNGWIQACMGAGQTVEQVFVLCLLTPAAVHYAQHRSDWLTPDNACHSQHLAAALVCMLLCVLIKSIQATDSCNPCVPY